MQQSNDNASDSDSSIQGVDDIYNEIMYHVLGQFLITKDNKNIATVLSELTAELKTFRKTISKDLEQLSQNLKGLGIINENVIHEESQIISSVASPSPSPLPAPSVSLIQQQEKQILNHSEKSLSSKNEAEDS